MLPHINFPKDLRKLPKNLLPELAQELREFIINIVAVKEGHLGASLGVVELTIALHYAFNTPYDILIWDVGHQAYGHKILTGRRDQFHTNRQYQGLSGFPKREESPFDSFGTGHASTSISAALGMAIASKLKGDTQKHHIAVIGDASIAGGMAFEGLNHAGCTEVNLWIILNDNSIGIDPSVGALKHYLTQVKQGKQTQDNIFEALNFNYTGPIDGHNLNAILSEIERLKHIKGPKFLHLITTKGKGLKQAERHQVTYHAPGKFNAKTGSLTQSNSTNLPPKFQDVFGETLLELAYKNKTIVGITPAMPTGSSLKLMMAALPKRAFDVGIAEQHAVTLAAGMATQGLTVFCNIYSTFLQRAYDQIIHDVALQNLPVIFCLDRAGLVGEDGATHHGAYDLSYLRGIPNLIIFAPRNEIELRNIMYTSQLNLQQPIVIRYPRGRGYSVDWKQEFKAIPIATGEVLKKGSVLAVLTVGTIANHAIKAIYQLENPTEVAHFDMRFIKPLDETLLHTIFSTYKYVITIEDGTIIGGFGSAVLEFAAAQQIKIPVKVLGIPDQFIEQGSVAELQQEIGLSVNSLKDIISDTLKTIIK